jgi:hypothetical protein
LNRTLAVTKGRFVLMNSITYPAAIENEKKEGRLQSQKRVFAFERRKHPRFSMQFPLDYSFIGGIGYCDAVGGSYTT